MQITKSRIGLVISASLFAAAPFAFGKYESLKTDLSLFTFSLSPYFRLFDFAEDTPASTKFQQVWFCFRLIRIFGSVWQQSD